MASRSTAERASVALQARDRFLGLREDRGWQGRIVGLREDRLSFPKPVFDELGDALGGRFATGDLAAILATKGMDTTRHRAREHTSLAQGTSGWNMFGTNMTQNQETIA